MYINIYIYTYVLYPQGLLNSLVALVRRTRAHPSLKKKLALNRWTASEEQSFHVC